MCDFNFIRKLQQIDIVGYARKCFTYPFNRSLVTNSWSRPAHSANGLEECDAKTIHIVLHRDNTFDNTFWRHIAPERWSTNLVIIQLMELMERHAINGTSSYNVPQRIAILWSSNILADPKSPILGFISESKRMLSGFKSKWTMGFSEWVWR